MVLTPYISKRVQAEKYTWPVVHSWKMSCLNKSCLLSSSNPSSKPGAGTLQLGLVVSATRSQHPLPRGQFQLLIAASRDTTSLLLISPNGKN